MRAVAYHVLDGLLGDKLSHAIVDAPPRQYDLRMIADHIGLVGQVIRIDTDAVSAYQAGPERQEIPFGACRL